MEPTRSSQIDAIVQGLQDSSGIFSSSKRLAYIKGKGFVAMSKSMAGSQQDGKIVSLGNLASKVKEYVKTHESEKEAIVRAIEKRKESLQGRITGIRRFFKFQSTINKIEQSIQDLDHLKRKVESNVVEDDLDYLSDDEGSTHSSGTDDGVGSLMQKTMTLQSPPAAVEPTPPSIETEVSSTAPTGGPPPPPPPPPGVMKSATHVRITKEAASMAKFEGEKNPPSINEKYDLGKVAEIPKADREMIAKELEKYAENLKVGIDRVKKKLQDHEEKRELVKGSREDLEEATKNLGLLGIHKEGLEAAKAKGKTYILEKGKNKTPVPVGPVADGKKYILSYDEVLAGCTKGIEEWEAELKERETANKTVKQELKEIERDSEPNIKFIDLEGLAADKEAVIRSLESVINNLRAKPKAAASPKKESSPATKVNATGQLDMGSQAQLSRNRPGFILNTLIGK